MQHPLDSTISAAPLLAHKVINFTLITKLISWQPAYLLDPLTYFAWKCSPFPEYCNNLMRMKRNHPPDHDNHREDFEEQRIIDDRLNQLFSSDRNKKVLHTNKGFWCPDQLHVRLGPSVDPNQYDKLVTWSKDLAYNYMNPYEALYFVELRQLLIFHNELPLSLPEAYQLLLKDKADLRSYVVFSHLNRNSFFCFKYNSTPSNRDTSVVRECKDDETNPHLTPDDHVIEPLFGMNPSKRPSLTALIEFGPQEAESDSTETYLIPQFRAFKRETYNRTKATRGSPLGIAHYLVIVCDKSDTNIPDSQQMLAIQRDCNEVSSRRYLFALVDANYSICFAQFKTKNREDLQIINSD